MKLKNEFFYFLSNAADFETIFDTEQNKHILYKIIPVQNRILLQNLFTKSNVQMILNGAFTFANFARDFVLS
jgi:hypothetical protein